MSNMGRMLVYNNRDEFLFELDPNLVVAATQTQEVNGVNAIDISTVQTLSRSNRLLMSDAMGKWYEYVINGVDDLHDTGKSAIGTYHGVWSLQYDLSITYGEDIEVGGEDAGTPDIGMAAVLDGTKRWQAGNIEMGGTALIEMFGDSGWERLQKVASEYGGEFEADISVGYGGVISRKVNMLVALGSNLVTRRFEWRHDVTSIRRKAQEAPLFCRMIPVGKGQDVTIEDVNDGVRYIEDSEAAEAYKVPDGQGGWEYPTQKVKFDIDDDRDLLAYAKEHITEYTRPVPTYEANVLQYAEAGLDYRGIALGDTVHIVDDGFNPDVPLRLEGRVRKMVVNLLDRSDVTVTIGDVEAGLSGSFRQIDEALSGIRSRIDGLFDGSVTSTQTYLKWLTGQLNQYINALGGWTYIVPGRGLVTYSVEVSDPEVGAEAKAQVASGNGSVTEIRGGSIRIANSLTSSGDWDWKTVFVSGQIAAELVTAARITTGYIGNATDGNYWNLDLGELLLRLSAGYRYGLEGGDAQTITTKHGVLYTDSKMYMRLCGWLGYADGTETVLGLSITNTVHKTDEVKGQILLVPTNAFSKPGGNTDYTDNLFYGHWDSISSIQSLHILSHYANEEGSKLLLHKDKAILALGSDYNPTSTDKAFPSYIHLKKDETFIRQPLRTGTINVEEVNVSDCVNTKKIKVGTSLDFGNYNTRVSQLHVGGDGDTSGYDGGPGNGYIYASHLTLGKNDDNRGILRVVGPSYFEDMYCSGFISNSIKSRAANTRENGKKLLYALETPTPMFSDIGSGLTDEDGFCYVMIDGLFSEVSRTDANYQVFLQKQDEGDIWVSEKYADYFIVTGTPNIGFDWEIKALQTGFENLRLDDFNDYMESDDVSHASSLAANDLVNSYPTFTDEINDHISKVEALYDYDALSDVEDFYNEEITALGKEIENEAA